MSKKSLILVLSIVLVSVVVGPILFYFVILPHNCEITTLDYEVASQVLVDSQENVIIVGTTNTKNFPSTLPTVKADLDLTHENIFISKFSSSGSVIWSCIVGGTEFEEAFDATIDSLGNIIVVGSSASTDFPTTDGSYVELSSTAVYGQEDLFILKISPNGSIVWSTVLGGSDLDEAYGVAVDSLDNIIVTGLTYSNTFPASNAYLNSSHSGTNSLADIFVTKLNPDGVMDWSYLLGGTEEDKSSDISTDSQDNVIITGVTSSSDFPRLNSQSSFTNLTSKNAFLTKFLPDGSIVWSKLLGGNDIDKANGLSVDSQDNIIFTGITLSNDFPVLNAYDSSPNLYMDAFLSKVAPNGDLLWSTYLGGSYADHGNSIAIDTQDNIAVVGTTYSSDFAEDTALGGTFIVGGSAYIVKFFPNGSQIILKQRFSGRNGAFGSIVTFDSMDNMLISGTTPSADFPTLNAYNSTISGSSDTFLLKLSQDNSLLWSTFLGGIGEETQICP